MANRDWKLRVYDRNTVDYDAMQQWDQESIEISSPPIWIYKFNLEKSLKDKQSSIDGLYLGPLVAVSLDAGYASNVVAAPSSITPFTVKRKAFSNKGFNNLGYSLGSYSKSAS